MAQKVPSIEETKLFLGGLPQHSTLDTLKQYFSEFGEVKEVEIMKDPVTKKSRGFGFVHFAHPATAKLTLARGKDHFVDGKNIEVKVAYKKGEEACVQEIIHSRKIFIGGLTKDITEEKLREFFSAYGQVTGVDIKKEKDTDAIRGFAFVEFSSKDAVELLLLNPIVTIGGKQVELKKVEPKEKTRPAHKMKGMHGYNNSGPFGGGRGGRSANHYQPYGGHYTYGGGNNYGGGGAPGYGSYGGGAPYGYDNSAYGGPPPPGPQPPPSQYGYPQQPPPPPPQGGGTGGAVYAVQQPQPPTNYASQTRPEGAVYSAPPPPGTTDQSQVGYPPTVGYNAYNQPTGYPQQPPPQQQQQQYYDPHQGAAQSTGYGRGAPQAAQRGGYGYGGGQWTQ